MEKKAPSTGRSFHNQNITIILSFKKIVYILSIKKYDIRKWTILRKDYKYNILKK